jgi:2-dehydro-3-deoxyphosphogluconate aldolase / (4S)-4-hydroxy-2-oxoglutarate aldolase
VSDLSLGGNRIIPVVVIEDQQHADPLAEAIAAGGINCVEVTLRTAIALSSIRRMADRGDLLIGAGTVFTIDQAQAAIDHGARFIVSPGLSLKLVRWCLHHEVSIFPGCATPTELQLAQEEGVRIVKFFPAEQLGGVAMLKTLSGVFRSMRFMPTGGISSQNIAAYLNLKQVVACGGSWMVRPEWIQTNQFDIIRQEVMAAVRTVDTLSAASPQLQPNS